MAVRTIEGKAESDPSDFSSLLVECDGRRISLLNYRHGLQVSSE